MKVKCRLCGKEITINNYQKRKLKCDKCADKLKKTRMRVAYHNKVNPNSNNASLNRKILNAMESQLKGGEK